MAARACGLSVKQPRAFFSRTAATPLRSPQPAAIFSTSPARNGRKPNWTALSMPVYAPSQDQAGDVKDHVAKDERQERARPGAQRTTLGQDTHHVCGCQESQQVPTGGAQQVYKAPLPPEKTGSPAAPSPM